MLHVQPKFKTKMVLSNQSDDSHMLIDDLNINIK